MAPVRNIKTIDESERRLISIVKDESLEEITKAQSKDISRQQKIWNLIHRITVGGMAENVNAVIVALNQLQKYLEKNEKVLAVGLKESQAFRFPPRHPMLGEVYALHPTDNTKYYTISNYHRLAFESKHAEAINLLSSLGANRIVIKCEKGWNLSFSASVNASAPEVDLEASAGHQDERTSSLYTELRFPGHNTPKLPDELHWYHYEPIWESVALSRINVMAENFRINLSYESDYGINGSLNASISKAGLKTTGQFSDQVSTVWSLEGDFGPRETHTE